MATREPATEPRDVERARGRRREWLGVAAIVAAAVALFSPTLRASYVLDDRPAIMAHPAVTGPFSLRELLGRESWGEPLGQGMGAWRPLPTLTYRFDFLLGHGSPFPFHLTNLVLFAALLVAIARFLARAGDGALSREGRLFVLALFAAMTIHVDVVPSIVGRGEILALLFSILAIDGAAHGKATVANLAGITLAVATAQLCKESTITLGLFVAYLALRRRWADDEARRAPRRWAWLAAGAGLAVTAATLGLRAHYGLLRPTRPEWAGANPLTGASTPRRLFGAADIWTRYLEHTFAPADLCPDYGYARIFHGPTRAAIGAAVALALVALLARTFRRRPFVADAIVGLGAAYVVVSQTLVASSFVMADRGFFAPSLWIAILVGVGLDALVQSRPRIRKLVLGAAATMVAVQAVVTLVAVPTWRDQTTLTVYAVRACPEVARIRLYRADAAYLDHDPVETAWAYLAFTLISSRFPQPLGDELAGWWEDEPIDRRLALAQARFGGDLVPALERSEAIARELGSPDAARVLAAWRRVLAPNASK